MRQEIPLREITIESIWTEVQKLRNELQTHNHLDIGNAQVLTGTMNGIIQSSNFLSGSAGCQINWATGNLEANSGYFRGNITGATGTFSGGIAIGTSPNWFKCDSSGNIWSGNATLAGAKTNNFAVEAVSGLLYCKGATIDGTSTIGGRLGSVLATAINSAGAFINANLDTSAKEILGDFTFGASGAIKMITDVNNGLWISPTGILGKKAGATTFAIDTSGNATFAGTLSAAAGTLGTITAGTLTGLTITGGTIQTASSGRRVVMATNELTFYDTAGTEIGKIGGDIASCNFINSVVNTSQTTYVMGLIRNPSVVVATPVALLSTQGYATGQVLLLQNTSTHADRNTNNVPMLDLSNVGTGAGIRIANNNPDSSGLLFDITQSRIVTTEPVFKIAQGGITSTNFRKIFTETNTGISIWISNGTTPNGNLTGVLGDICLGGDNGNIYRCSTAGTTWTAM